MDCRATADKFGKAEGASRADTENSKKIDNIMESGIQRLSCYLEAFSLSQAQHSSIRWTTSSSALLVIFELNG